MLCAFVFSQLISAIFGIDPLTSLWSQPQRMTGVFVLIHLLVLFFCYLVVFRSLKTWKIYFLFNLLVGIIVIFLYWFPIFQSLNLESNGGSTLGNSTLLGTYLLFLISFGCILLFDTRTNPTTRILSLIFVSTFIFTLFETDAQAAQMSFLGACAVGIALGLIRLGKRSWMRWIGWSLLCLLISGFLLMSTLLFVPNSFVRERLSETGGPTRLILWETAWQAIKEKPFLGWGPEQFSYVSLLYYNPCLGSPQCGEGKWADRTHNIILETLVGSGVVGLIAYLGVFAVSIFTLWKRRFSNRSEEAITIIVLCLLSAYLVQNLTGFDSIVSLWFWFMLLAFVNWRDDLAKFDETTTSATTVSKKRRRIAILATLLLPVGFWYFVVEPFIGFKALSDSVQAQTIEDRLIAYQQAVWGSQAGLAYRRSYIAYETSSRLWYATRKDIADEYAADKAEIEMAKNALLETIKTTPNYLRASLMLARVYQIEHRLFRSDALVKAQQILEEAVQQNPNNPLPRWALTSILIENGNTQEALKQTQLAYDLNPDDPKAHLARLVAAKFARDEMLVQTYLEQSMQRSPTLTNELQSLALMNTATQLLVMLDSFY